MLKQKWFTKLLDFDYGSFYKPDKENLVADVFFRMHEQKGSLLALFVVVCTWADDLNASWTNDLEVQQLIVDSQNGAGQHTHYEWNQGILKNKGRLVTTIVLIP